MVNQLNIKYCLYKLVCGITLRTTPLQYISWTHVVLCKATLSQYCKYRNQQRIHKIIKMILNKQSFSSPFRIHSQLFNKPLFRRKCYGFYCESEVNTSESQEIFHSEKWEAIFVWKTCYES